MTVYFTMSLIVNQAHLIYKLVTGGDNDVFLIKKSLIDRLLK